MTWADTTYRYKKKITIDNTKVAGNETNFPVLVSVIDGDLADTSNGGHVRSNNGYDICFYESTETTLLYHEIERYINTSGELIFWVNIPSLSSTIDTVFYMYYGKSGVVVDPSSTNTWNSSFVAVYHMKDITTSTIKDSTSNGNNGTKTGANQPNQVSAKIGYGQDFTNQVINCGNDDSLDVTNLTVEAWFLAHSQGGSLNPRILGIENNNGAFPWAVEDLLLVDTIGLLVDVGAGEIRTSYIPFDWSGGSEWNTWIYGVWTFTNGVQTSYKNAIAGTSSSKVGNLNNQDYYLRIGNSDQANRDWDGVLDEVRIHNDVKGANWVTTSYNTQNSPTTFMSISGEITMPGAITLTGTMHFK